MIGRRFPVLIAFLALGGGLASGPVALAGQGASTEEVESGILLPGILPEGQVVSTTGHLTITPSGNATLVCHGQIDPALAPKKTLRVTDIDCALGAGGQVGESHVVLRPNGGVTMTCHNNPGSAPFDPGPGD